MTLNWPLTPTSSFGTANGANDGKWKQTKLNFGSFLATPGFGTFATTSVMAPRLMKAEPGKKHEIMVSDIS